MDASGKGASMLRMVRISGESFISTCLCINQLVIGSANSVSVSCCAHCLLID